MVVRISKNRVALENIPLNEALGANIASAATVNLTNTTGNTVHLTGTTTITAITLASGSERTVVFDGILTLTHHSTNNNLPGGVNITTALNDRARYIADGTTVYCVNYQKADGTAVVGGAGIIGDSSNLVIKNNATNPNYQLDITADEVILKTAVGGTAYLASSVSKTADITASGANGLDTGAEGSSTWYYIWLIYNGTTVASLLSTSSTPPTMPSGYTYKALMGAVYNDSSGNFRRTYQHQRDVSIVDVLVLSNGVGTTSYTALSISAAVPPIARFVSGMCGSNAGGGTLRMHVAGDANWTGAAGMTAASTTPSWNGFDLGGFYSRVPLITSQTIYHIMESTASGYRITVSGYSI